MQVIRSVEEMQAHAEAQRCAGTTLALVPTMGALHRGHLALVEAAKGRANHVTVSIFVNPTQFGPGEDYERYPRPLDDDLAMLEESGGVDVVFVPPPEAFYPKGVAAHRTWVQAPELEQHLCGSTRPGHFRGVTTVVTKLFNSCRPHLGVFGLKDAQQFLILRRLVHDLNFGIELVGVPTVREPDGLALSSRNRYLNADERAQAVVLSQAVTAARAQLLEGEQHPGAIVDTMRRELAKAPDANVQYAEVVDTETIQPLTRIVPGQEVLAAVAVFFGKTRLIDNTLVQVPAA